MSTSFIFYQFNNIKDWLMDGVTTNVFWNKPTFGYALKKMCMLYFMFNGTQPHHVMDIEAELHKLANELGKDRLNMKVDY